MKIFLSHNQADKHLAREFGALLVLEGLDVWFDEWAISAGDSITGSIEKGLRGCSHLVLLWSKNARRSRWVTAELRASLVRSMKTGKPKIVPVRLDATPLPILLRDLKYIQKSRNVEETRRTLILELTGKAPEDTYLRALVQRYHSAIWPEGHRDPSKIKACPSCGGLRLKHSRLPPDDITPGYWQQVDCEDCHWKDLQSERLSNKPLKRMVGRRRPPTA